MITVEIPLRSLEREVERLQHVEGGVSQLYARGALDTISWILSGSPAASDGGSLRFPLLTDEDHVH